MKDEAGKIKITCSSQTQFSEWKEKIGEAINARKKMESEKRSFGVLEVELKFALGVKAADIGGKSDPYCVVHYDRQTHKSAVIKSTLEPVWNEKVSFHLSSLKPELVIAVYDMDKLGKDEFLGMVSVDLKSFEERKLHHLWYSLEGTAHDSDISGAIYFTLNYEYEVNRKASSFSYLIFY